MQIILTDLQTELLDHLGVTSTDSIGVTSSLNRLINWSLDALLDSFEFRAEETSSNFSTAEGTIIYNVPADLDSLERLAIEDLNTLKHSDLIPFEIDDYENVYVNDTSAEAKPEKYVRRGSTIMLWPTPDNIYTIINYYRKILPDMSSGSDLTGLPPIWGELVLYGAVWRGFAKLGDIDRMEKFKGIQENMILNTTSQKSKERNQSQREAGLEVKGLRDNYFR